MQRSSSKRGSIRIRGNSRRTELRPSRRLAGIPWAPTEDVFEGNWLRHLAMRRDSESEKDYTGDLLLRRRVRVEHDLRVKVNREVPSRRLGRRREIKARYMQKHGLLQVNNSTSLPCHSLPQKLNWLPEGQCATGATGAKQLGAPSVGALNQLAARIVALGLNGAHAVKET